jgi:hypothetical protein
MEKQLDKPRCPRYTEKNVTACGVDYFNNEFDEPLPVMRALKTGVLLKCPVCQSVWFVDAAQTQMEYLSETALASVEKTNSKKFELTDAQIDILK